MLCAEEHRGAKGGGLDHRVQSCAVKSTANKGHIGKRVEVAEHANPIDDDHIGRALCVGAESCDHKPELLGGSLDGFEMVRGGLVRRDNQSCVGDPCAEGAPGGEQRRSPCVRRYL